MKINFFQPFSVRYYETDAGGKLSVENLCNYMQQIAGQHAHKLGVGFDHMQAENLTWVLARWQVSLERMPGPGEELCLETWPSAVEKLQCRRDFILRGPKDEVLARAASWWVVVNSKSFRLERPPAKIMELSCREPEFAMESFSLRLPQVKDGQTSMTASVRWSDIDGNQHVNNANYLDWVLQSAPRAENKICLSAGLKRFEINFKSEARLGDVLEAKCESLPGLPQAFAHSVYNQSDGKEVIRAFTQWE